ncbi:CAP domain-containing protein [Geitlerinema sp. PCC 7407]|uniref:CAP domain-containing protein n=1 Tax=Geitlerinema sp. PCC 7407 TaxID=1173025 RepID=UPI00029FC91B|nr:CAP domain-containing protein [Geitlerinema sp. PCC 7407]AFY65488.1 SCP-like extracellular [Geitlerinema sp. PCC 7407]
MKNVRLTGLALGLAAMVGSVAIASQGSANPAKTALPSTYSVAQVSEIAALEQEVFTRINQYRTQKGLAPLSSNNAIAQQARSHSQAMANGSVPFSHDGFSQRVSAIGQTIAVRGAAENVAYNMGHRNPAQVAVDGWLKSPGHRGNIEGNYSLTGIGIARNARGEYYFTQIFIRPR